VGVSIGSAYGSTSNNIKSSNNGTNGFSFSGNTYGQHHSDLEASGNGAVGISATNVTSISSCYSHDNTGAGFSLDTYNAAFVLISESNASHGLLAAGRAMVGGYIVVYGNTGASTDGIQFGGAAAAHGGKINNIIAASNGRYGINRTGTNQVETLFNGVCTNANGTAALNNVAEGLLLRNYIAGDPKFTAPTANPPDFTLQSDSPCLNAGFPDANWATNIGLASGRY
jgi:hypothetical protein